MPAAGFALSSLTMGLLFALSQWVSYSTEYSNWANSVGNAEEMLPATGTEGLLIAFLCGLSVVILAMVISLVQIRGNLRAEPLKLFSARES